MDTEGVCGSTKNEREVEMALFKKKGSLKQNGGKAFGIWWYEFSHQGTRIRESANTKNRTVAARIMAERRRSLEEGAGNIKPVKKRQTFAVASKEWLDGSKAQWSPNNYRIETTNVGHLLPHFGRKFLTDVTTADVKHYQNARLDEGASPKTINLEVSALRSVLGKLQWAKILDEGRLKMLKVGKNVGRALSEDERVRLLAACKRSRSRALHTAVLTSLHTGLRSNELRNLRWRQVDLIGRVLTVGESKTAVGTGRKVPLSQTALTALKEWRAQFPEAVPEHFVFPSERYGLSGEAGKETGKTIPYATDPTKPISSFKTAWTAARKAAGISCRWHDCRHTCITDLAEAGANDHTLKAIAGHVSNEMMEHYSHVRLEAKRAAIAAAFNKKPETASPHFSPPLGNYRSRSGHVSC
jgi:integrase